MGVDDIDDLDAIVFGLFQRRNHPVRSSQKACACGRYRRQCILVCVRRIDDDRFFGFVIGDDCNQRPKDCQHTIFGV
jgi:hypothetical protein